MSGKALAAGHIRSDADNDCLRNGGREEVQEMTTSQTPHPDSQQQLNEESIRRGHETRDVNPRIILWLGAVVVVGVLLVQGLLWGMLAKLKDAAVRSDPLQSPLAKDAPAPPPPRLQSDSTRDYDQYRDDQLARLNSYGWVDREQKIVRIPISRAIDLTLQRDIAKPKESGS